MFLRYEVFYLLLAQWVILLLVVHQLLLLNRFHHLSQFLLALFVFVLVFFKPPGICVLKNDPPP